MSKRCYGSTAGGRRYEFSQTTRVRRPNRRQVTMKDNLNMEIDEEKLKGGEIVAWQSKQQTPDEGLLLTEE